MKHDDNLRAVACIRFVRRRGRIQAFRCSNDIAKDMCPHDYKIVSVRTYKGDVRAAYKYSPNDKNQAP